jgi:hypothetical protein
VLSVVTLDPEGSEVGPIVEGTEPGPVRVVAYDLRQLCAAPFPPEPWTSNRVAALPGTACTGVPGAADCHRPAGGVMSTAERMPYRVAELGHMRRSS